MNDAVKSFLRQTEKECYQQLINVNKSFTKSELFCELHFDGILCWPATEADTYVNLPCPDNIIKSELKGQVTRKCESNGEWYTGSKNEQSTNYNRSCGVIYLEAFQPFNSDYALDNSSIYEIGIPIIKSVTHFGYGLSMVTLLAALFIFATIKKLRCARNRLHMHLFISFIMRALMAGLKDVLFVHGVALATDATYVEGKLNSFNPKSVLGTVYISLKFIFRISFTEGLPILFTIPWALMRLYFEDDFCWTSTNNAYISMIIEVPIALSVIINFILFLIFVRILCIKLNSIYIQQRRAKYRKLTKSTLILVPVFGVPYTISLLMSYYAKRDIIIEIIWLFFDQTFTSFQGFFAAVIYCLINSEVRTEIKQKYNSFRNKSDLLKRSRTISQTQNISIPLQDDFITTNNLLQNYTDSERKSTYF